MEKAISLNQTQLVNIIRIPLHHFPTPFHIQGMVINPAYIVLVHVSDLEFNPVRVESFIVQYCAERMPEAMPYYPPLIPQRVDHPVYCVLAHDLRRVISTGEHIHVSTCQAV